MRPEQLLPHDIVQRGLVRGNEYAWPIEDIPKVIEAARLANLVSLGGQLQFRLPDGICECYWVDVSTDVPTSLPWQEQVDRTAAAALANFTRLLSEFDFVAEGRTAFAEPFKRFEAQGGDPVQTMCFVWYLTDDRANDRFPGHDHDPNRLC